MFEDTFDMAILNNISSELTCNCDEFHICQQCSELALDTKQGKFPDFCTVLYNTTISVNNKLEVVTWEAFVCSYANENGIDIYNLLPIALKYSNGIIKAHKSDKEKVMLETILKTIYKDRYVVIEESRLRLGSL